MIQPKISVIIPVYNVEKYLKQCLDSIVNQTYKNLEIIIVNDGTKDNSMKIVEEYLSDSRVKVINKENGGISSARNRGIEEATGEYISFVDSDDFIDLNLYNTIIKEMSPREQIYIFNYNRYKEKINYLESNVLNFKKMKKVPQNLLFRTINGECWNKIYKTSFIKENNLRFPEGMIYEDVFWEIDTLHFVKKVKLIDFAGYTYRCDREGSIVNTFRLEKEKITCQNLIKKVDYFLKENIDILKEIQKYRLNLFKIYIQVIMSDEIEFKNIESELDKIRYFINDKIEFLILREDIQRILKRKSLKNIDFKKLLFWRKGIYNYKVLRRILKNKYKKQRK